MLVVGLRGRKVFDKMNQLHSVNLKEFNMKRRKNKAAEFNFNEMALAGSPYLLCVWRDAAVPLDLTYFLPSQKITAKQNACLLI